MNKLISNPQVQRFFRPILSFLMLFSVYPWMQNNAIFFIPLYLVFSIMVEKGISISDKRLKYTVLITSLILSTFHTLGFHISMHETIIIFDTSRDTLNFILQLTGTFALAYFIVIIVFNYFEGRKPLICHFPLPEKWKSFWVLWGIIFIAWLPYAIINYPGILSPDSITQINQIMGDTPWNNHNPAFHTFILFLFIKTSLLLNASMNLSVFSYIIFQMLILSAIFAYALRYMVKRNIHSPFILLSLCFYAFYPVHGVYSVTIWSDILFSGSLLVFTILCDKIFVNSNENKKQGVLIIFILLTSIFMIFIRHTGLYVFIISMTGIFVISKTKRSYSLMILVAGISLFYIYTHILLSGLSIKKTPPVAVLSIPIQQIARTAKYHQADFSENIQIEINRYFKRGFDTLYDYTISDPIKEQFFEDEFNRDKSGFYKLWRKLLCQYPKTYMESFLYGTLGYWYPDVKYWILGGYIYSNNYNIHSIKLLPKSISHGTVINVVNYMRTIPLLGMFFSIGFTFWLLILTFFYNILIRNFKLLLIFIPVLVLYMTALASPVYAEFRYVYGMFIIIPVLLGLTFYKTT